MLKREITYENFNGEKVSETFYFNLTKSEMLELEVSYYGGLQATIKRIVDAKDNKSLVEEFKKIILLSYGVRSDDGKRFIKNDTVREEFSQTAAFDELFIELATNDQAAVNFIQGVLPRDMVQNIKVAEIEVTPGPDIATAPTPPEQTS
jgi:hypothetical protein